MARQLSTGPTGQRPRAAGAWTVDQSNATPSAHERAGRWLSTPELRRLVRAFEPGTAQRLEAFTAVSRRHLDTRGGRERQQSTPVVWTPRQIDATLEAAGPLGLRRTPLPSLRRYDHTLVLGGTVEGNVRRAALLVELLDVGLEPGRILAVGTQRPLMSWEATLLGEATEVHTELGHLQHVVAQALGSGSHRDQPTGDSLSAGLDDDTHGHRRQARVVDAPSSRPGRRADTLDAVRHAAGHSDGLRSALLLTSAIYAPYTYFSTAVPAVAAQFAGRLEVVGTPTAASDLPARQAQAFGQEVHATLTAIGRLTQDSMP